MGGGAAWRGFSSWWLCGLGESRNEANDGANGAYSKKEGKRAGWLGNAVEGPKIPKEIEVEVAVQVLSTLLELTCT